MSASVVTYANKSNTVASVDPTKEVRAEDMNELKIAANNHAGLIDANTAHLSATDNPHSVTKAQVGLGSVINVDTTNPANITQSAAYRFVSDAEKTSWDGKQDELVSGTDIKTINSESILGSGDLVIDHSTIDNRDAAGNHAKFTPTVDNSSAFRFTKADGTTACLNINTINGNTTTLGTSSAMAFTSGSDYVARLVNTVTNASLEIYDDATAQLTKTDDLTFQDSDDFVYYRTGNSGVTIYQKASAGASVTLAGSLNYRFVSNDDDELVIYQGVSTEFMKITSSGNVGFGESSPTEKMVVNGNIVAAGSVRVGDDAAAASADKLGSLRYRSDANNSYCEMCMQTGTSTYTWVEIKKNTW